MRAKIFKRFAYIAFVFCSILFIWFVVVVAAALCVCFLLLNSGSVFFLLCSRGSFICGLSSANFFYCCVFLWLQLSSVRSADAASLEFNLINSGLRQHFGTVCPANLFACPINKQDAASQTLVQGNDSYINYSSLNNQP